MSPTRGRSLRKFNSNDRVKTDKTIVSEGDLVCSGCSKIKKSSMFYISYNPNHSTGKTIYCKDCIRKRALGNNKLFDIDKFKNVLQEIDKPFVHELLTSAMMQGGDVVGNYIKNISLPKYRGMFWKDSVFSKKAEDAIMGIPLEPSSFEISPETKERWGDGYQDEEYFLFEKKYAATAKFYPERTGFHTEALITWIRYKVKEEMAVAKDKVADAERWGKLAGDAAKVAKINPNQMTAADLSGGMNSFGEIMRELEKTEDIVPILPQFKYRPQDAVDFIMWCYINYVRDMLGFSQCSYEDIYAFYDKKVAEYIKTFGDPNGIFANNPTESNREKISNFITIRGVDVPSSENEEII
jgi:hypothetical protein